MMAGEIIPTAIIVALYNRIIKVTSTIKYSKEQIMHVIIVYFHKINSPATNPHRFFL